MNQFDDGEADGSGVVMSLVAGLNRSPVGMALLSAGIACACGTTLAYSQSPLVTATVPQFTDIASTEVADATGAAKAVAWVDYDVDGDADLYIANDGTDNKLFRNDGAGVFEPVPCGAAGDAGPANGVAWADYDNDGDPDLFLAIANGTSKLIRNDGGGAFIDVTSASGLGTLGTGVGLCAWGDYDNDGWVDLCVGKIVSGGNNKVLLLQNLGGAFNVNPLVGVQGASDVGGLAWADYDEDGLLDLFVGRDGAHSMLLHNRGNGEFDQFQSGVFEGAGNSTAALPTWADYDGDGDLDLYLVRNRPSGGDNALLRYDGSLPNGSPIFTNVTGTGALVGGGECVAAIWCDFDNDGKLDLWLLKTSSSTLLQNNGAGAFLEVTTAPLSSTLNSSAAWADFDGDGMGDIFICRNAAPNRLLRNTLATSNAWLGVSLRGVISNRSAVGSRVRIISGGVNREAQVVAGDNGTSQGSLDLEFGLGAASTIDSVVIFWPSGIAQAVIPPPAVNSTITITETGGGFVDATASALVGAANTEGAAWADYDGDGDLDLYAARYGAGQANRLWRNDGSGAFTTMPGALLAGAGASTGVAWGDYDNDGVPDLFVANSGQPCRLLRNNGAGVFTEATLGFGPAKSGAGAAWADYDNDGDLDIYVANLTHPNQLFRNEGGETFVDVATGPVADQGVGISVAWADYDNDGDADLYLSNSNSSNRLLRNNGVGGFEDVTIGALAGALDGRGAVWADWDRDGDLDLVLADGGLFGVRLLRNDSGAFIDVTSAPLSAVAHASSVGFADYDNDGDEDLYVVALLGGQNKLFSNDGAGHFSDATANPLGAAVDGVGGVWGDYDSDGRPDLFVANYGSSSKLLRNAIANGNHWLKIRLKGVASNNAGIGAQIQVVTAWSRQTFEVSGASGYMSQSAMPLHVGLGEATRVDSVIIRWPSRLPQIVTNLTAVDRLIQIEEDTTPLDVRPPSTGPSLRLSVGVPNPFRGSTRIDFELSEAREVELAVFDLQGRQVQALMKGTVAAGRHSVVWNGANKSSERLPAGVYFVRLDTRYNGGHEVRSQKAVVLR